ncbi:MAG TPA: GAF domain-containing protein [Polyangiaceae bacterium]|jgi:hypothetical protein|nr:GAF domain-containing protein [Polyangiaceae bacterium]
MARVAVDLSPVVTSLLTRPFDQPSLDRAYDAVGGHPQAYATALRCAAKKTDDSLAAAYWFAEAARIHEAMDDLGGAIALLWRALECDRSNPRSRELLAAAMVRLSMRAGLGFTFAPSAAQVATSQSAEGGPLETGLRPPAAPRRRDTIPEVFGSDSGDPESERRLDAFGDDEPITGTSLRATLPSAILKPTNWQEDTQAEAGELEDERVQQLLPPPKNPSSESGVIHVTRSATGEPVLRSLAERTLAPAAPLDEGATEAKNTVTPPSAFPEAGPKVAPMPSIVIGPEPKTPESVTVEAPEAVAAEAPLPVVAEAPLPVVAEAPSPIAMETTPSVATEAPSLLVAVTMPPPAVALSMPPPPSARHAQVDAADVTEDAQLAELLDSKIANDLPDDVKLPDVKKSASRFVEPKTPMAPSPAPDEVYAEEQGPPTLRPAGDRLVGGLFEALHGLHFLPDVRQGAAFVCRTLTEKMRPATMLVHLYDINSGHFLIVSAQGNRAAALLDYATPETDAFIVEVMKSDESTLVQDPASDPRFGRGRWALAEPKRSVLCAPLASEGRQLGLLELVDPADGGAFTEDDRNALMYAASALSRFIDRRGLVLSDEPERSSPEAAAR